MVSQTYGFVPLIAEFKLAGEVGVRARAEIAFRIISLYAILYSDL